METTATFDKATDEFILHTPTVTATKYWPGDLGLTSNHAVVMARMIINGKDYGPQPFMVQIRDRETHLPMPGIELGDIGSKIGYESKDNGYMILNHYRIPRTNLVRYIHNHTS